MNDSIRFGSTFRFHAATAGRGSPTNVGAARQLSPHRPIRTWACQDVCSSNISRIPFSFFHHNILWPFSPETEGLLSDISSIFFGRESCGIIRFMTQPAALSGGAAAFRFGSVLIHGLRCSNSCVFCRAGDRDLPEDLARAAEIKLHRETIDLQRRGIANLNVSGSEPLKYSKIIAYLRWARPLFRKITLLDPGNRLHDESFARELAETGVDVFVIPLYGSRAPVHDRCVGNRGAFGQVTKGISSLLKHKNKAQRVEISTIILKQNAAEVTRLPAMLKRRFGIASLAVNSPMAAEEAVGRFFGDFNVPYEKIRQVVLDLVRTPDFNFHLRYIPPCLFDSKELAAFARRGGMELFNVPYTYELADSEENREHLEYVGRYREQVATAACGSCSLAREDICGGILRMHHEANRDFEYHGLSKDLFRTARSIIRIQRVNR